MQQMLYQTSRTMIAKDLKNFVNQLADYDIVTAYQSNSFKTIDLYAYHREEDGGYPQQVHAHLFNTLTATEMIASLKSRTKDLEKLGFNPKKQLTVRQLKNGKLMKLAEQLLTHYVASSISAFCLMFGLKDPDPVVRQVCHDIKKVNIHVIRQREDEL